MDFTRIHLCLCLVNYPDSTPIIDDIVANNARKELLVKWRINLDDDVESNITFRIQIAHGKNLSKVNEVRYKSSASRIPCLKN